MEHETISTTKQAFEGNLTYNNAQMLQVNADNFVVTGNNAQVNSRINSVISRHTDAFFNNAFNVLYPSAIEDYLTRTDSDIPFNGYGAAQNFEITYNQNCTLSMYDDTYQFTGGAHGTTVRSSNTFSTKTGAPLPSSTFLSKNDQTKVLQEIKRQATQNMQQDQNIYFENYLTLIDQTFQPNHFYITTNGMVYYFQQYDIAPYAVGIVEFTIPFSMVTDPPTCK